MIYRMVLFPIALGDSGIFNDTKRCAVFLRQLSFLFELYVDRNGLSRLSINIKMCCYVRTQANYLKIHVHAAAVMLFIFWSFFLSGSSSPLNIFIFKRLTLR